MLCQFQKKPHHRKSLDFSLVIGGVGDHRSLAVLLDAYLLQGQRRGYGLPAGYEWERASRALFEKAGILTALSTENPECRQIISLVANSALISFFFKKNLMITRRNVLVQIGLSQSAKQFLHSRNCTTTSVKVSEGDMHKFAPLIEATLQNDTVIMGIPT